MNGLTERGTRRGKGEMAPGRILIAEDFEPIRSVCAETLMTEGYTIDAVSNGMEALEMVRTNRFDLVITDIEMPLLDGLSFYRLSVGEFPYLKKRFLFMTGNISKGRLQSITHLNESFLVKPFPMAGLVEAVRRAIARER